MKLYQSISMMLILISCSIGSKNNLQQYEIINNLWQKKSNLRDISDAFGTPNESNSKKAVYFFPNSKTLKMEFTFNSNEKIEAAFLFLEKSEIEPFKKTINCKWIDTTSTKQVGSTTYLAHQGKCSDYPLRFKYFSSLKMYEVWWSKTKN